ncbi:DUF3043 domain-containing protein [Micrococcus sp.]|uniref:DUF3043 domain-containing protein n=1 Tax=Micrococcus sp. TaxID=1271 RepID=UPI002A90986F|nr:DUF3043 domain-containing protein [Micrococcus sp.]MDY6055427.1 DUF3043 domain-containing protein [Micrococcus sp.]
MLRRRKTTETPADGRPEAHGSTAAPAGGTAPSAPDAKGASGRRDRSQGKGVPTPRRKDQEAARRRTLVPEDRKAARRAEREAAAAERRRQREAMITGDERALPQRDRGPQRRWVRDFVDARTGVAEFLLPVVVLYIFLMMVPSRQVQVYLMIALYVLVAVIVVEAFLITRRVRRGLTERFGQAEPGTGFYAVMRALQFRRLRLPKPQVARGQHPR